MPDEQEPLRPACGSWRDAADYEMMRHDCGGLDTPSGNLWSRICSSRADKLQHRRQRNVNGSDVLRSLRWVPCEASAPGWSARRMLALLRNKVVAVVGDSLALGMWCALTCSLIANGAIMEYSGKKMTGKLAGLKYVTMRSALAPNRGDSSRWLLGQCGTSCSNKGVKLMSSTHVGCGDRLMTQLIQAAALTDFAVVLNACGTGIRGVSVLGRVQSELVNVTWADFGRWPSLLPTACPPSERDPCSRGADLGSYRQRVNTAAARVRALTAANPRSIGMLLETPSSHFPVLDGCLQSAQAGMYRIGTNDPSDWDAYVLSSLEYARQMAARPGGLNVIHMLSKQITNPAAAAKGPANVRLLTALAKYEQWACPLAERGQPAAASCSAKRAGSDTRCLLESLKTPHHAYRKLLMVPLHCEPRRVSEPLDGKLGYRQQIERAAAGNHSVPLLERFVARISRHDAHTGARLGMLDCMHNSLAPGVFEPEVLGLMAELERHASVL